jgi:transcriptional regulator GlxA family with amidase domain
MASVLNNFASEYTRDFDAGHSWPSAIRAAAVLRDDPAKSWHVDDLAKAVFVSPATLARSFSRTFGASVLQYHARLRLRSAVEHIRASKASIEGILVEHGYRSAKDCYRLFRRLSGMTLSDVRRLSEVEYASLVEGTLALPSVEWRTHPPRVLR